MDHEAVIAVTRRWIQRMVIGLNLCPFAERVFEKGLIRYVVSDAAKPEDLLRDLAAALHDLAAAPITTVETTLLIHPRVLRDFLDYNDFLDDAEGLVSALGLEGVMQIASFHPAYQFAGTEGDAAENYTNRSPYPMLHLLREESITRVATDEDELADIPRRNVERLEKLGREAILEELRAIGFPPP